MNKKFRFMLMTFFLSFTLLTPIMAMQNVGSTFNVPTLPASTPLSSPKPHSTPPELPQAKPCAPCHRPFKRLVKAMYPLKKTNDMTEDEFKKAYTFIVKLPKETFDGVSDPDLKAAELLHKGKIITDAQYKKICASLKDMPIPPKPSSAPNPSSAS